MESRVVVRQAVDADVRAITRIYNQAILQTTTTFDTEPKTLEEQRNWFRLHTADYPLLTALVDGEVAGWGSLSPYGRRRAYRYTVEDAVYVDPPYQSRGVGTAILRKLLETAERKGYHTVIAQVVAGNDVSLGLHRKLGFEEVGRLRQVGRKFDRWLDVIVLQRIFGDTIDTMER